MKCDICRDRPAVIFVQQVSRDSSVELHLCEVCARERGFSTNENRIDISLGGIFSNLADKSRDNQESAPQCPVCGFTFQDIRKRRKTGCAECYRQFRAEIVTLLRQEGIEIAYSGELPEKASSPVSPKVNPDILKKELQKAIEQENYELAAYYRDRLRTLGGET